MIIKYHLPESTVNLKILKVIHVQSLFLLILAIGDIFEENI